MWDACRGPSVRFTRNVRLSNQPLRAEAPQLITVFIRRHVRGTKAQRGAVEQILRRVMWVACFSVRLYDAAGR